MTWKCAVVNVPFGGRQRRNHLQSDSDVARRARTFDRRYTSELLDFIGPDKDVPAPDMNTNEQNDGLDSGHIFDARASYGQCRRHRGNRSPLGGSLGRREATGRGVIFTVNEAIKRFNLTPGETSVVVQGSGKSAALVPALMSEQGYKVPGDFPPSAAEFIRKGS
jgi:glutamate dehydrogenase (NAD(P)+)